MKNLNPYNKQDKYSGYQLDKALNFMSSRQGECIKLNWAWGIKGISRFIRLYVKKIEKKIFCCGAL